MIQIWYSNWDKPDQKQNGTPSLDYYIMNIFQSILCKRRSRLVVIIPLPRSFKTIQLQFSVETIVNRKLDKFDSDGTDLFYQARGLEDTPKNFCFYWDFVKN